MILTDTIVSFATARSYLPAGPESKDLTTIAYIGSLIDCTEEQIGGEVIWDDTRHALEPAHREDYPSENLFRLNMKDITNFNYLEWFPSES